MKNSAHNLAQLLGKALEIRIETEALRVATKLAMGNQNLVGEYMNEAIEMLPQYQMHLSEKLALFGLKKDSLN